MAKKTKATPTTSVPVAKPPTVRFPEISAKDGLECRTLLEDQILLIDVSVYLRVRLESERRPYDGGDTMKLWLTYGQNLLSPEECKTYVKFIDSLPLELTPPKKRGEAERVNRASELCSGY